MELTLKAPKEIEKCQKHEFFDNVNIFDNDNERTENDSAVNKTRNFQRSAQKRGERQLTQT